MTAPTKLFLLDTNVLITAARHYYAFDIAPGFWSALHTHACNGGLCSIDKVRDEINRGEDHLVKWVNDSFHHYFIKTDTPEVIQKYTEIMRWAQSLTQFKSAVKQAFAQFEHADPWLVAYALANCAVVVTLEVPNPTTRNKIPLPIVCDTFGVPWVNTFDMLRESQIQLS